MQTRVIFNFSLNLVYNHIIEFPSNSPRLSDLRYSYIFGRLAILSLNATTSGKVLVISVKT